jgi:hypothetical protein
MNVDVMMAIDELARQTSRLELLPLSADFAAN